MSDKYPLPPGMEPFVQALVDSGRYEGEGDVIWHALELLKDREAARSSRLTEINAKIDEAIDDIEAGGGSPADEVFAQLRQQIRRAATEQMAAE